MKKLMLITMGAMWILGCSAADNTGEASGEATVESTDQAVVNGWIGPVSEEAGKNSATCGSAGVGATAAFCSGAYCDDMYLFCGSLPRGFATTGVDGGWTPYVSDENNSPAALCGAGNIVDGIRATGSYADNVSIHCTSANFPTQGTNCAWTPWFSEEQGQQNFKATLYGRFTAVARGVKCSGSYCDNMSYFVCEPKCQTDADCGSGDFCRSGTCVIG